MFVKNDALFGSLHIRVSDSRYLDNPKSQDATVNLYVKCDLLPDRRESPKKKTSVISVIKGSAISAWKEVIVFNKTTLEELLKERVLEVTIWDARRGSSHDLIGGVRLGPSPDSVDKRPKWLDSIGDEIQHWKNVLTQPEQWVSQWHTLRDTMAPREITF